MSCQFPPNTTISAGLQWWEVADTLALNKSCGSSYLRPDVGGALMPWLFTILQIVIHLPVVVARVARWEDVQTLSIVLALFNVAIVAQSYAATKLAPEHVLVWSPVTMVIDAGAMLQLMVLVRAVHPNWMQELKTGFHRTEKEISFSLVPVVPGQGQSQGGCAPGGPNARASNSHPLFVGFVIITSSLLFLTIFGLQMAALIISFRQPSHPMTAAWCSPMFGFFSISELDLHCTFRPVKLGEGIGCIDLPGVRQKTWLAVTKITLVLAVCIEGIDAIILSFVSLHSSWWIVQLKRPFFTMIFGLIMLVLIFVMGTMEAYSLPDGITVKMWLVVDAGTKPHVCVGHLAPAGLRGQLIGWLDGLLKSWKTAYYGY